MRSTVKKPCCARTLPWPPHRLQRRAAGARFRARTGAGLASLRDFDLDLRVLAVEGLVEPDLHVIAQIRAAPRLLAAPAKGTAEEALENIAEVGKAALSAAKTALAAHSAILESGMAELVIGGALLRVFQAVIGLADRLEFGLGIGAAGVLVGMPLHRQPAIGRFDRAIVGAALDFEQFVVIGLAAGHRFPHQPSRHPRASGGPTPADAIAASFGDGFPLARE